jgi:hypothetical protein
VQLRVGRHPQSAGGRHDERVVDHAIPHSNFTAMRAYSQIPHIIFRVGINLQGSSFSSAQGYS